MRIAIVNDLSIAVEAIRRVLKADGTHQLAWVAHNGLQAVEKCAADKPDLILMDLIMPILDGVEATRRIMASTPCPILVVTGTVGGHAERAFEALGAGALDVVKTPVLGATNSKGAAILLEKIDILGKQINSLNHSQKLPRLSDRADSNKIAHEQLVTIGASAGGPMALMEIMAHLPANFSAPIVIVQHVDRQFIPGLIEWLNQHSHIPVRLAKEGERPLVGTALMADTADHLVFTGPHRLGYTRNPVDYVYRPSIDVFFQSVARHWRGKAIGILLTGMGRDGAKGLKLMRELGHHTIAQDQASSAVYGMPKAAATLEAAMEILPLNRIGQTLRRIVVSPSIEKTNI